MTFTISNLQLESHHDEDLFGSVQHRLHVMLQQQRLGAAAPIVAGCHQQLAGSCCLAACGILLLQHAPPHSLHRSIAAGIFRPSLALGALSVLHQRPSRFTSVAMHPAVSFLAQAGMACCVPASSCHSLACLHVCPQACCFTSCITFQTSVVTHHVACVCRSSDPYLVFQRDRMVGHKTLLKTPVGVLLKESLLPSSALQMF